MWLRAVFGLGCARKTGIEKLLAVGQLVPKKKKGLTPIRGQTLRLSSRRKLSGAEGDRTLDLVVANDALSQLSYSPKVTTIVAWGSP